MSINETIGCREDKRFKTLIILENETKWFSKIMILNHLIGPNRFLGRRFSRVTGFGSPDIFRGFEMRREMEREFDDTFRSIETKAPKDLVREYETAEGGKVRKYGPFVYGY